MKSHPERHRGIKGGRNRNLSAFHIVSILFHCVVFVKFKITIVYNAFCAYLQQAQQITTHKFYTAKI